MQVETRMLRADLIQVFKIPVLHNIDHVDKHKFFFTFAVDDRRGHAFKLYKDRCILDISKLSFSNRVCDSWNHLPNDTVTASSLNMFKNKLDRHLRTNWGLQ